ncbi:MAG: hypothetical protein LBR80_12175 [Deltaproteobacteria bacterium]|jgi:hypothetical protein|nr:hypothetical protein [Deltaproteobacteria bacterium]
MEAAYAYEVHTAASDRFRIYRPWFGFRFGFAGLFGGQGDLGIGDRLASVVPSAVGKRGASFSAVMVRLSNKSFKNRYKLIND